MKAFDLTKNFFSAALIACFAFSATASNQAVDQDPNREFAETLGDFAKSLDFRKDNWTGVSFSRLSPESYYSYRTFVAGMIADPKRKISKPSMVSTFKALR